ncbi:dexamethasone-induced protein isoform X1 [Rattus norvegicus]|uniref:dexamethasone-induced protein isoform X1 n=1 Tax=Rattus norvegicus TaxID=10116 RepID=UPI0003D0CA3B|nr:dexamethasone-induced protein isoform X1 [Rattus norvegicus]|eukprot:XP_017452932.1 PREDICTED: dexamethasone-induced protein isoform X1 [Rattus norvegicus]
MPLPLAGGTIWTGMGPQEEARLMKICLVERTKCWTSLHGDWSMNINHCYDRPARANNQVPAPTQASARRSEDSVPRWGVARSSERLACHPALRCSGPGL